MRPTCNSKFKTTHLRIDHDSWMNGNRESSDWSRLTVMYILLFELHDIDDQWNITMIIMLILPGLSNAHSGNIIGHAARPSPRIWSPLTEPHLETFSCPIFLTSLSFATGSALKNSTICCFWCGVARFSAMFCANCWNIKTIYFFNLYSLALD